MRWLPGTFWCSEEGDAAVPRLYVGMVYGPQTYPKYMCLRWGIVYGPQTYPTYRYCALAVASVLSARRCGFTVAAGYADVLVSEAFRISEVGDAAVPRLYVGIVYGPQIYPTYMYWWFAV